MKTKRITGIVLIICGIVMFFIAQYIKGEVETGKGQARSAQKKVDQAESLFDRTPATKPIGKGITSGAQSQIDAGWRTIAEYQSLADWLRIGGIIVAVVGAGILAFSFRKRHH